jgi:hypothetical protein
VLFRSTTVAEAPGRVVGPPRPVADPGRPLTLSGSLDAVVAGGLGLDLAAIRRAANTVGVAAALAAEDVPLAEFGETPLREGPEVEALRARVHAEIEYVAGLAAGRAGVGVGAPQTPRAARGRPARDALDDLVDRIPDDQEEEA